MIASFITEHNTIGSTRGQQIMAWKTLNWNPVQERLDDFVYRLKRIGQELVMDGLLAVADGNLAQCICCTFVSLLLILQLELK